MDFSKTSSAFISIAILNMMISKFLSMQQFESVQALPLSQ